MTNISFISGTRADYGKIKPYIDFLITQKDKNVSVFITGMNMLKKYGYTYKHIKNDLKKDCNIVLDKKFKEKNVALEMAHIIQCYTKHLIKDKIDFVFVHGDRPEVLAATSAAVLNNIPVCHIEAGDLSGSIDESLRHASSKLAQQFLVADKSAEENLVQMGENPNRIHITGNSSLAFLINQPSEKELKILNQFKNYAILIYHPVTTISQEKIKTEITEILETIKQTDKEYVIISPNNDLGSETILSVYNQYKKQKNFHFAKSFSFEGFNYLLKRADFLIGNSSCGIKEAPYYDIPVINIGCRQSNRFSHLDLKSFYHLDTLENLANVIQSIKSLQKTKTKIDYRDDLFKKLQTICTDEFFNVLVQKSFYKK